MPAWRRIGLLLSLVLVAQVSLTTPVLAASGSGAAAPVKPNLGTPVKGVTAAKLTPNAPLKQPSNYTPTKTTWPAATTSTVSLSASASGAGVSASAKTSAGPPAAGGKTYASGTPVWVQAQAQAKTQVQSGSAGATSGPTKLGVKVLSHSAATAVGVSGMVVQVAPTAGGSGSVRVGVDYSSFAEAFGGDYAGRLRLVTLPACALTTPQVASCHKQTPLASTDDQPTDSVSANVAFGSGSKALSATNDAVVLAVTAAASGGDGGGSGGQFGATALKPSGSWSAGGSSGSFTYSYPMTVPQPASAMAPSVSLSYDSGSVDGQTASTQSQSSWIGDGWSMADSYVEETFASCSDSPEGVTLPTADQTGDMCYDGPILTLSLDGQSSSLLCASSCGTSSAAWKPTTDDGEVVSHITGANNGTGTYNTDYWRLTTRDGTVYDFGLNELPGWTSGSGDATTNSVDTEPVYSANSGDPCYNISGSGFTHSVCTMGYKYHLDYVKDLHGNAMAYYYKQAVNYYGEDNGATTVPYTRDSYLDHIDYGFTDPNAYGTVPDKVVFTPGDRCVSGTCDPLNATNAPNWPDVPYDQICPATGTCANSGPSFFSEVRLTGIATEQYNGTGYNTVDSWALTQTIPTTGTYNTSTLWLNSIQHTGSDTTAGGSSVQLNPVTFTPTMLANRVNYTTGEGAGLGPLNRYRIGTVTTETGSEIGVNYELVNACTATSIQTITPSTNTASCYPVNWTPSGYLSQFTDWFNKYVVQSVTQSDLPGGAPTLFTGYTYRNGGAWHYDDNEVVQAKYRTYGQWRGYGDVQTRTGQGTDPQTLSEDWYYRGMDGDYLSPTSTRSVTLTDTNGGTHTDSDELAGDALESANYTYDGGPLDSAQINSYWISTPAATRTRTGLPSLTANTSGQVETWTEQAITDSVPTTYRKTETDESYDTNTSSPTFGLLLYTDVHGDLSLNGTANSQETCTQTSYAPANTAINLVGLVDETQTDDKACGGTDAAGASAPTTAETNALTAPVGLNLATDITSDTRTFYDNATLAQTWPQPASSTLAWPQATPTLGMASVGQSATGYASGALTYQTKSAKVFDSYGRPTISYDADGNKTTFGYTMTAYGTVTGTLTTNALTQKSSTTIDPERSIVTSTTDSNSVTTTAQYDGLGRTIAVWNDNRPTSAIANTTYSYAMSNSAPSVVTTKTMNDSLGQSTSTTIYDALLRVRETQAPTLAAAGGRLVTDTFYDSHGWVVKSNNKYWDTTSAPNGTLVSIADQYVPNQTQTTYDGLGRPTVVNSLYDSTVESTAYTEYLGDRIVSVPPTGAVASATVTDALGRTTELDQYTAAPNITTGVTGGFTTANVTGGTTSATTYTFNAQGRPYQTTDANGDTWSTGYDFQGQAITSTDPDSGSTPVGSPTVYDAAGNVVQTTNSAGQTQSLTYDALGRKVAEYDATVASQAPANEIASWVYDNSNNAVPSMLHPIGQLTTETSYTPDGKFTEQAGGFNVFGEPSSETYTVPGTSSLAGSYVYKYLYSANTGLPGAVQVPAAGGMSAEALTNTYAVSTDSVTMPAGLSSSVGNVYVPTAVQYTGLGQVAQESIASSSAATTINNTYDAHTGALTDQAVKNSAGTMLDETSYGYDPSGNITDETDTRNGTTSETQCYNFDQLNRLDQAWTTNAAKASAASSCQTQPTSANVASTVSDGIAGSAYWTTWTFDAIGQPQQQDQHALTTGGTDTSTTYTYNGNGTGQPNTLTKATVNSGSSTSNYSYNSLGQTTSRATPAGQQSLTWNDEGKLQSATTGTSTSTYDYDASGAVIEQSDPGKITLFLPDQQVVLTGTTTLSNTRTYALPGGGAAIVTNAAHGFILTDPHGTATIQLDATGQNPVWQQTTPYGAPRGTAAGSSWLDPNGFLNKPQDTSDDLTTVGARQYDTILSRFISQDEQLDPGVPESLNGYTYAGDNPITNADPSGNRFCQGSVAQGCCPPQACTEKTNPQAPGSTTKPAPLGNLARPICDQACLAVQQESANCASKGGQLNGTSCEIPAPPQPHHWWETALAVALVVVAVVVVAVVAGPALIAAGSMLAGGGLSAASVGVCFLTACAAATVALGSAASMLLGGDAAYDDGGGISDGGGDGGGGADPVAAPEPAAGGTTCGGMSFTANTGVVLASGAAVAISSLKVGDKVLAVDTATGKTQVKTVDAVLLHYDTNLYDLTVKTSSGEQVVNTTSNHLFWDQTTHTWVEAGKLHKGDQLRTDNGTLATAVSGTTPADPDGWMWDLTIDSDHDFYVVAGNTPILVHNCTTSSNAQILDDNMQAAGVSRPAETAAHHIVASTSPKAASARAQLASFGIDINDAGNGVYLPRGSASSNPLGMAVHSRVHTNLYYDNVNEMMSWAQNADQARDVLGYIRNQLQSGPWP